MVAIADCGVERIQIALAFNDLLRDLGEDLSQFRRCNDFTRHFDLPRRETPMLDLDQPGSFRWRSQQAFQFRVEEHQSH